MFGQVQNDFYAGSDAKADGRLGDSVNFKMARRLSAPSQTFSTDDASADPVEKVVTAGIVVAKRRHWGDCAVRP